MSSLNNSTMLEADKEEIRLFPHLSLYFEQTTNIFVININLQLYDNSL